MNPPNIPSRTIIVSEEIQVIKCLSSLLSDRPELTVEAEFSFPKHGIDYLLDNVIDLVFLDIQLSALDCLTFLHFLKESRSECPVVVFLTKSRHEAIDFIVNAGFEYLIKPIEKRKLDILIDNFKIHRKDRNFRDKIEILLEEVNYEYK